MAVETPNRLYFGDCLDVMREDIPAESVDLIYLDPPFNSKRLYNAFIGGAQWVAFDDTWRWHEAIEDFDQVAGQAQYKGVMEGLRLMLGDGPQLAYISATCVRAGTSGNKRYILMGNTQTTSSVISSRLPHLPRPD